MKAAVGRVGRVSKRRRGRPRGPKTVRYSALLEEAQRRDLDIIRDHLEGKPNMAGVVREALAQYIAHKRDEPAIRDALDAAQGTPPIRVVK